MNGMGEVVLETRGLTKSYGPVRAVRALELRVRAGEIYGFLGLNGAGKTTSIRMMLGLIRPDAGTVRLFGQDLRHQRRAVLGRIGSLAETATAYPNLTVRENLELQRRLIGAPRKRIDEVIAQLKLEEYVDRRAGVLSLGNKQRLALARALLGTPDFLILDEPVNGLDPAGIVEIRGLLRRLAREQSTAILMSSHLLDEVEQIADRIGIIHQGQLVDEFAPADLAGRMVPALELEVDDVPGARQALAGHCPALKIENPADGTLLLKAEMAPDPVRIARLLVGADIGLRRMSPVKADLETLFLGLTGGES